MLDIFVGFVFGVSFAFLLILFVRYEINKYVNKYFDEKYPDFKRD